MGAKLIRIRRYSVRKDDYQRSEGAVALTFLELGSDGEIDAITIFSLIGDLTGPLVTDFGYEVSSKRGSLNMGEIFTENDSAR